MLAAVNREMMLGFLHCALTSLLFAVVVWTRPQGGDHKARQQHMYHATEAPPPLPPLPPHPLHPHPVHLEWPDECNKLGPANADFAFALYKKMAAKSESKNVFFSPLGIVTALSLLAAGSKGDTHQQLYHALGYSQFTTAQVNEAYGRLHCIMAHSQGDLKLDTGSAIVLQDGFTPLQKFLDDGKLYYQAQGFTVNFTKPEAALQTINSFVAEKTDNKIPDLLSSVDGHTVMMLLNYIHFRGKWEKPFDVESTVKADFRVDKKTTVSVDMMKRMGLYSFYYDPVNHTSVLMLPYKGDASMMIILPGEGKMEDLEAIICKECIILWQEKLVKRVVCVEMPKFSVSGSYSLEEFLKQMGIVSVFSDTADLSGISEDIGLKVSKVSQKAVLRVDEKGTEAAAATVAEIIPYSMPDTVCLDRPFLLFILEESTKSILFMGKITDPTAQ